MVDDEAARLIMYVSCCNLLVHRLQKNGEIRSDLMLVFGV